LAVRFNAVTLLLPVITIAESSVIVTVPPVTFRLPKFVTLPDSSPNVIALAPALNVARPVTSNSVPESSVIAPLAVTSNDVTLLVAVSSIAESSVTVTAAPYTFRAPKFVVSLASSPSVTALAPASSVAWFDTDSVVPAVSVIVPSEIKSNSVTLLLPVKTVAESSETVTIAPVIFRLPKFVVSLPLSPRVMSLTPALNVAWFVTRIVVPGLSVMLPFEVRVDADTSLLPVKTVAESSVIITAVQ